MAVLDNMMVLSQVEKALKVTRSLVCRWCREGRFEGAEQLPNGGWLIPREAVAEFKKRRRGPGRPRDAA